jgi:RimJ/RimL family protein N-acetyltransferase
VAIRLERLGERHLGAVVRLLEDADVLRFTRVPEPVPDGFPALWLARYEEGRRDGTREAFAIEDDGGSFVGLALAPSIEPDARTVELGYIVAREARGRGVATGALRLLTEWAFGELGAHRIELMISVENEPSKRVAERAGYVREGTMRSVYLKPGVREDVEIWSRLATDP